MFVVARMPWYVVCTLYPSSGNLLRVDVTECVLCSSRPASLGDYAASGRWVRLYACDAVVDKSYYETVGVP